MIGSGTENDPYLIVNEDHLIDFFATKTGYANFSSDVILNKLVATRSGIYELNLKGFTLTVNDSSGTEEIIPQNEQGWRAVKIKNGNIICNVNKSVSRKVITKSRYHDNQSYNSIIENINVVYNINCQGTVKIGVLFTTYGNTKIFSSVIRSESSGSIPDLTTCKDAYIIHSSSSIKPGDVSYADIPNLDRNKWKIEIGNPIVVKQYKRFLSGKTLVSGTLKKRKVVVISSIDKSSSWEVNSSDDGAFNIILGDYRFPVFVIASDIVSGVLTEGVSVVDGDYLISDENKGKKYYIKKGGVIKNLQSPLPTHGEFTSGDVIIRVEDIAPSSSVGPVTPASRL